MSNENHLGLSQEIFEELLFHLDIKDLLSCSRVCVGWRNAVNSERVWRQISKIHNLNSHDLFSKDEEPMAEERKHVLTKGEKQRLTEVPFGKGQYHDDLEGNEHPWLIEDGKKWTNLTPLCDERRKLEWMHFFLKTNWRIGQYRGSFLAYPSYPRYINSMQTDYEFIVRPICKGNDNCWYLEFYKIHYNKGLERTIFEELEFDEEAELMESTNNVQLFSRAKITGYDTAKIEKKSEPFLFTPFFKLSNNVLVLVHSNVMISFTKDTGYSKIRLVTLDGEAEQPKDLHKVVVKKKGWARCDHNGEYFVGSFKDVTSGFRTFHVWDLKSLNKIKEVELPNTDVVAHLGMPIHDVEFSLKGHIVGLQLTTEMGVQTALCTYDLLTMRYSSVIYRDFGVYAIFTDKMIISTNVSWKNVSVFDFSGRCKYTAKMNERLALATVFSTPVNLFGNILVTVGHKVPRSYIEYEKGKEMIVRAFDISKKAQIDTFRVTCDEYIGFHLHMVDLMIISTGRCLLIRDIKTRKFLQELPYTRFLPPDASCTKIFVMRKEVNPVICDFTPIKGMKLPVRGPTTVGGFTGILHSFYMLICPFLFFAFLCGSCCCSKLLFS